MNAYEIQEEYGLTWQECCDYEPVVCECGSTNVATTEGVYGMDADGRRGIIVTECECRDCGRTWE